MPFALIRRLLDRADLHGLAAVGLGENLFGGGDHALWDLDGGHLGAGEGSVMERRIQVGAAAEHIACVLDLVQVPARAAHASQLRAAVKHAGGHSAVAHVKKGKLSVRTVQDVTVVHVFLHAIPLSLSENARSSLPGRGIVVYGRVRGAAVWKGCRRGPETCEK